MVRISTHCSVSLSARLGFPQSAGDEATELSAATLINAERDQSRGGVEPCVELL